MRCKRSFRRAIKKARDRDGATLPPIADLKVFAVRSIQVKTVPPAASPAVVREKFPGEP